MDQSKPEPVKTPGLTLEDFTVGDRFSGGALSVTTESIKAFAREFDPQPTLLVQQLNFVKRAGKWLATPLFTVLVLVETTDIIFAVDSIPAIFAVTQDTFLVFTSNAFAILGLRAMYFLLADLVHRFIYLKAGLAAILVFVGLKMLLLDVWKVPIWLSLTVIAISITVAIVASLRATHGSPPVRSGAELDHDEMLR